MQKTIFITSGTTFTLPSDWSGVADIVECIGAGGNSTTAAGAGGGAYSKAYNITLYNNCEIHIGVSGSGDTWFNGASLAASSCGAKGGSSGSGTVGGAGGIASSGIGSIKYSGGRGGNSVSTDYGGGGGAGGPKGNGAQGGDADVNAKGGGGAGGGSAGGSTGGNNWAGIGGGAADTDGTNGGGGGPGTTYRSGGKGGNGTEWDATHGAGGGGGADRGTYDEGTASGSYGGLYGGGAGTSNHGYTKIGGQGIIVVTYTPFVYIDTSFDRVDTPSGWALTPQFAIGCLSQPSSYLGIAIQPKFVKNVYLPLVAPNHFLIDQNHIGTPDSRLLVSKWGACSSGYGANIDQIGTGFVEQDISPNLIYGSKRSYLLVWHPVLTVDNHIGWLLGTDGNSTLKVVQSTTDGIALSCFWADWSEPTIYWPTKTTSNTRYVGAFSIDGSLGQFWGYVNGEYKESTAKGSISPMSNNGGISYGRGNGFNELLGYAIVAVGWNCVLSKSDLYTMSLNPWSAFISNY